MPIVNENERQRYQDGLGRLQFKKLFDCEITEVKVRSTEARDTLFAEDVRTIHEKIETLHSICEGINQKFDFIISAANSQKQGTDLMVYNAPTEEKTLVETKNIFGKTVWKEEKV